MIRLSRPALASLCCLTLVALPVRAQVACPDRTVAWEDETLKRIFNAATDEALEQPPTSPPETQITAPSGTGGGTSLVNEAAFPSLFGLAVDNGLVQTDSDKITVNLNLFAFKALAQPKALFSQTEYEKHSFLRRFGGSVSFGGKGESFDRDGDGQADEALTAEDLDDIVTYELRIRLLGSRDRRDRGNYRKILGAANVPFSQFNPALDSFRQRHGQELRAMDADGDGCVPAQDFESFVSREQIRNELEEIGRLSQATLQKLDEAVEKVDRKPLWTLVVGGIERKDQFGPSSLKAALRGALSNHTLNLEYTANDSSMDGEDPQTLKLGYEYSMLILEESPFVPEGIELSFAGSWERFEDVPDALHDENAKANVRFDFPLTRAVKIPVSVTWANHKDLLTDEKEIRGHIGFTVDLSKLTKPLNDKGASGSAP